MDPLLVSAIACGVIALVCWLLSVVTDEYSWVDRLWSIVPAGYAWGFAWTAGFTLRTVIPSVLITLWAARLTFNFARKGGYAKGGEDYRWAELRKRMSKPAFAVFNVLFIAGFQNALLLGITLPVWRAAQHPEVSFGAIDAVLAVLFLALLVGETIADEQQWRFQQAKKAARDGGQTPKEEFLTDGLFRYSRHPNFFCEVSMWWTIGLFAVVASGTSLEPTLLGAVVLTGLFQGSTNFTEELSLRKYPRYAEYQKRTSRLIPMPPRG